MSIIIGILIAWGILIGFIAMSLITYIAIDYFLGIYFDIKQSIRDRYIHGEILKEIKRLELKK